MTPHTRVHSITSRTTFFSPYQKHGADDAACSLRAPHQVGNPSYVRDAVPPESPWDARETVKARLAFVIENHRKS